MGRPRVWDGKDDGFPTFEFKFVNWMAGFPGEVGILLERAVAQKGPILYENFDSRIRTMSKGIARAFRSLVEGKALSIVKNVDKNQRENGFLMWRLLMEEYKPGTAIRKVSMLENLLEEKPLPGESFADWYRRWKDLARETEEARSKPIDDDIKCAVVTRQAQGPLKDHLLLNANTISENFATMNDIITSWLTSKKEYGKASQSVGNTTSTTMTTQQEKPVPMEIGAISKGKFGHKGKGWNSQKGSKGYGKESKGTYSKGKSKGYEFSKG